MRSYFVTLSLLLLCSDSRSWQELALAPSVSFSTPLTSLLQMPAIARLTSCDAELWGVQGQSGSVVHNASQRSEQQRLRAAHPGEPDIVVRQSAMGAATLDSSGQTKLPTQGNEICYVKGLLQPTRSIGDFNLKESRFAMDDEGLISQPVSERRTSHPYISAAPEVKAIPRNPHDELLVLASDGLWEFVSGSDVVSISKPYLAAASSNNVGQQKEASKSLWTWLWTRIKMMFGAEPKEDTDEDKHEDKNEGNKES